MLNTGVVIALLIGFVTGNIFTYSILKYQLGLSLSDDSGWTLVYENDSEGNDISGNLDKLTEAVRQGADIKVSLNSTGSREGITICDWVYIDTTTGKEVVTCLNTSNISVRKTAGYDFGFQNNAYHAYMILNTEGKRDISRWYVGEHRSVKHSQDRIRVKWLARID